MPRAVPRWALRAATGALTLAMVVGGAAWWYLPASLPDQPELRGTLSSSALTSDGRDRTWLTYEPAGLQEQPPLLVVLHGSSQDGAGIREANGRRFDQLADRHGFVVAYPDGVDGNWNECRRGGNFTAKKEGVDDAALVRGIVDELAESGPRIDRSKVFVTGYSSGGQMSLRVAREAPDLIAGFASVAANVPAPSNDRCTDIQVPVPALFVTGIKDPLNPFQGGDADLYGIFGTRGAVLSATDGAAGFAARNGSTSPPTARHLPEVDGDDSTSATLSTWSGVAPVRLLTIGGGGHHYPSPGYRGPRYLGPSADDVEVPRTVAELFALDQE